jgi:hypothetical protein
MSGTGNIEIQFVNTKGLVVNDIGDIILTHTLLSQARYQEYTKPLKVRYLVKNMQEGRYKLMISSLRHRTISRFINVREGITNKYQVQLPINPERVKQVIFPTFDNLEEDLRQCLNRTSQHIDPDSNGEEYYKSMSDLQKACLLNIHSKMRNTRFDNGLDVFGYMSVLKEVRGARFYALVNSEMWSQVQTSLSGDLFERVSGLLHESPDGYQQIGSFKTRDNTGNLQLTFFKNIIDSQLIVDADIDDANGIAHMFQVVRNEIRGSDSHPYDIREILLVGQSIDPGYDLIV